MSARRGVRWFWAGFALGGWGYLLLACGPWLGRTIGPGLPTTTLIDAIHDDWQPRWKVTTVSWVGERQSTKGSASGRRGAGSFPALPSNAEARRAYLASLRPMTFTHYALKPELVRRLGHSLICLFAGLLGGLAAIGLGQARDRGSPRENAVT